MEQSVSLKNKNARVAQLVEYDLAKVGVAGSSPVSRSQRTRKKGGIRFGYHPSFLRSSPTGTRTVRGLHSVSVVAKRTSTGRSATSRALRKVRGLHSVSVVAKRTSTGRSATSRALRKVRGLHSVSVVAKRTSTGRSATSRALRKVRGLHSVPVVAKRTSRTSRILRKVRGLHSVPIVTKRTSYLLNLTLSEG